MSFGLQFTSESDSGSWGKLTINSHVEVFESSFSYWNKNQYENAWVNALEMAIEGEKAALIIWMEDPSKRLCIDWWPIYRDGEVVYLQNAICDLSLHAAIANDEDIYQYVPDRFSAERVSEWRVSVKCIREWLDAPAR